MIFYYSSSEELVLVSICRSVCVDLRLLQEHLRLGTLETTDFLR